MGLAGAKQVVIVLSRGGIYTQGSPAQDMDHQEAYLKVALGFMGINAVEIVRAEGVNMNEQRERVIENAQRQALHLLKAA